MLSEHPVQQSIGLLNVYKHSIEVCESDVRLVGQEEEKLKPLISHLNDIYTSQSRLTSISPTFISTFCSTFRKAIEARQRYNSGSFQISHPKQAS